MKQHKNMWSKPKAQQRNVEFQIIHDVNFFPERRTLETSAGLISRRYLFDDEV